MLIKFGNRMAFGLFWALLAGLLVFSSCDTADMTVSEQDQGESKTLVFTTPLEAGLLTDFVQGFNLKTREIQFKTGEITAGYSLQSDNLNQEIQNALKIHAENVSKISQFTELTQGSADATLRQEIQDSIATASQGQVLFSGITAFASPEVFERIREQGIAEELTLNDRKPTMAAPSLQSLSHESWAPHKGSSVVQRTYIYNTLYFNNTSPYDSNDTYEHETQVYDKDFADYGGYWSSNFPNAYKDTQFDDRGDIDNFTIGCAKASSLQTNKQYYGYMTLKQQRTVNPTVRIKGQLGHRWPSWCYSTWCIFADATTQTMVSFTAPMSGMCWQY